MFRNRLFQIIFCSFVCISVLLSCSSPTNMGTDTGTETETEDLPTESSLADYGIDTNLGPRLSSDNSQPLPEDAHPLTTTNVVLQSFKEISATGFYHSNNGSGDPNFIVDDAALAAFGVPVNETGDSSWIKWPHSSCGTDLDGDGIQEVTTVIFEPSDTSRGLLYREETPGKVSLKILRKSGNDFVRTDVAIPGAFSLFLGGEVYKHFAMSIAAGDVDGDGHDEVAISVGNTVLVVKVENNAVQTILAPVDYRAGDSSPFWNGWTTFISLGDLDGDGKSDLLVCDGKDNGSTYKASYDLYLSTGNSLTLTDTGIVANNTHSMQMGNPLIGDIDNDGQAEAVFLGDYDSGDYSVIIPFEWDSNMNKLQSVQLTQNYLKYHNHLYFRVPLKILTTEEIIAGKPQKMNRVVVNREITEYSASGGFAKIAELPSVSSYGLMDIGDVNRDGQDDIVYIGAYSQEEIVVFGRDSSGTWDKLNTPYYADIATNECLSLAVADLDGDSNVLQFLKHEIKFTDPEVVGVLASVPFYSEYGPSNNSYTSFGQSNGSDSGESHSFTLSAAITIGGHADTPLWGTVGTVESKVTLEASFNKSFGSSNFVNVTKTFKADGGEDHVLFASIPFDVYSYRVLRWSTDDDALPGAWSRPSTDQLDICLPREPQILPMELNRFNDLPGNPISLDSSVLSHTIGVPSSYPSLSAIQNYGTSNSNPLARGMVDTQGFTVIPSGNGVYEYEFEQGSTASSNIGGGFTLSHEWETVTFGVLVGGTEAFGYEYERSITTSSSTILGAGIPYLPSDAPMSQTFKTGLAAYSQNIPGQSAKALVVNFWVD